MYNEQVKPDKERVLVHFFFSKDSWLIVSNVWFDGSEEKENRSEV